jgi:hypothetical protein
MEPVRCPEVGRQLRILAILAVLIPIGLFSRTPAGRLPWLDKEVGDLLWATAFYLFFVLCLPRRRPVFAAALAIAVTFSIEFLKFYRAPWIESVRSTYAGGLLLGHKFFWHDFLSYALGVGLGLALDRLVIREPRSALSSETVS